MTEGRGFKEEGMGMAIAVGWVCFQQPAGGAWKWKSGAGLPRWVHRVWEEFRREFRLMRGKSVTSVNV